MVRMLYPISSKVSGDMVIARFGAEVNGKARTVVDIFTAEQWAMLCSGQSICIM